MEQVQKEKVIVKISFPKSGVPIQEMAAFYQALGEALPSFDVVVVSTAPFGQGAN